MITYWNWETVSEVIHALRRRIEVLEQAAEPPPAAGPGLREAAKNLTDLLSEPEWATKEQMRLVSALEAALTRADEDARLLEAVMKWGYISCDSHGTTHAQRGLRTALDELKAAREGGDRD